MNRLNSLKNEELIKKIEELNQQIDIFKSVQSTIPSGISLLDADTLTYTYANSYYSKLINTDPKAMIGQHISKVIGDEKFKQAKGLIKRAIEGEMVDYEGQFNLSYGLRWLKVFYTPYLVKDNKVRNILISSVDITAQKEAQIALQESEKLYRELFQNLPDAIVIQSNGTIKHANPSLFKLTGYAEGELIGHQLLQLFSPKKAPIAYSWLKKRLQGITIPETFEDHFYLKNGKSIDVEISTNTCTFDGEPSFQIIIRNITERKKAQLREKEYYTQLNHEVEKQTSDLSKQTQKLRDSQMALTYLLEDMNDARDEILRSNTELATANTDLESFDYSVSYDLRAPLRHIDGFTQLLQNKIDNKPDDVINYFNKIHNASSKMHNLINDLLTFSRLGRKKLNKSTVDLNELFAKLIKEAEPDMHKRNIQWHTDQFPNISGDMEMLKIAFENLLSNAIKFTSKNEVAKISIVHNKENEDDRNISIMIEDNGVGFEMKYAHKIFGVFERLHNEDDFTGTGIGMAIVQRIVQSHKGKITAYGKKDEGARFTLSLPIEDTVS